MNKISKNKKLNYVFNDIYNELEDLGIEEVKHYYNDFKGVSDYNIVQDVKVSITGELKPIYFENNSQEQAIILPITKY